MDSGSLFDRWRFRLPNPDTLHQVLACAEATEKTCGAKASAAGEISVLVAKQAIFHPK
jgi:hypothetical protein